MSNLSERLNELMDEPNELKSEKLGKIIGVTGSSIRMWKRGEMEISLENAVKLADYFQCNLDYLAGRNVRYEQVAPRPLPPFYERLRAVMKENEITRYWIAHNTDIKDVYFTHWKQGATPYLANVIKLATYLNVSLDYLVGRTDY